MDLDYKADFFPGPLRACAASSRPAPCSPRAPVSVFSAELLPASGFCLGCFPRPRQTWCHSVAQEHPSPHHHSFTLFYFLSSSKGGAFTGVLGCGFAFFPRRPAASGSSVLRVPSLCLQPATSGSRACLYQSSHLLAVSLPPEQSKPKLSFKGRGGGHLLMVDPDSGLFRELMMTKPKPSFSFR